MSRSRKVFLESLLKFLVFMVIFLCVSLFTPQCSRWGEQNVCRVAVEEQRKHL